MRLLERVILGSWFEQGLSQRGNVKNNLTFIYLLASGIFRFSVEGTWVITGFMKSSRLLDLDFY